MKYLRLALLIGVIIWSLRPLFMPGFYDTHDGLQHLERFIHVEREIKAGNWVPYWLSDAGSGYGSPLFVFNWLIPYWIGVGLHSSGLSYITVFKVMMGFSLVASAYTMYRFAAAKWGKLAGTVASILYVVAPYRFLDMYVRGALGEALALPLLPLLLLAIDQKKFTTRLIYSAATFAVLVMVYPAFALMVLPIALLYCFVSTSKQERWRTLLFVPLGLLASAFAWVPSLLETKYMLIYKEASDVYFPPFIAYLKSPWQGGIVAGEHLIMSYMLGYAQWLVIGVAAALVVFKWKKLNHRSLGLVLLACTVGMLVLLVPQAKPLWLIIPVINRMLFAYRWLAMLILTTALLAGWVIKNTSFKIVLSLLFIALAISGNRNHIRGVPQQVNLDLLAAKNGTMDSNGLMLPVWTDRATYKFLSQAQLPEMWSSTSSAALSQIIRQGTKTKAHIATSVPGTIYAHRLYFPGWQAQIDGRKVEVVPADGQFKGLVTFPVPSGEHQVSIEIKHTPVQTVALAMSFVGIVLLSYIVISGGVASKKSHVKQ